MHPRSLPGMVYFIIGLVLIKRTREFQSKGCIHGRAVQNGREDSRSSR